jgi:uncharacterized protein YegL
MWWIAREWAGWACAGAERAEAPLWCRAPRSYPTDSDRYLRGRLLGAFCVVCVSDFGPHLLHLDASLTRGYSLSLRLRTDCLALGGWSTRSTSKDRGGEVEPKGSILLVYFVADESGSMSRNIGELNAGLVELQDALQKQPFAAARVRFSVIGFSDTAFTHLEAADLRSTTWLPTLSAQGLTSYAAAFDELGLRIAVDIPHLKQQGFSVLRPAVFFLTDGQPNANNNWRAAQAKLLGQPTAPNIIAFGIGDADAQIVCELATNEGYAFKAARGVDTGAALSEFLTSLTQSVISSGKAVASGNAELQFERPEGFTLAVDVV